MLQTHRQSQDEACSVVMDAKAFPHFARLLDACGAFAAITGGRYTSAIFHDFSIGGDRGVEARKPALPVVAEYICQISEADASSSLLAEFRIAEKMVLREAVFVSMVATCRSVELWPAKADIAIDDTTYQDMSETLDVIAQRLFNFVKARSDADEENMHQQRMFAASFVVEFGREHGFQPGEPDLLAETMLFEFLARVRDWGQNERQEVQPCLESLPPSLRERADKWWKENWKGVACVVAPATIAKGVAIVAICHLPIALGAAGVAGVGVGIKRAVAPRQDLRPREPPERMSETMHAEVIRPD
mmetsp:Transcript_18298/g.29327  ORF Transcript_18298/g.29327 Transcript_18298/m.29327 type:complete len:303 (-) Transcript_18298:81-989(-)